MKLYRLGRGKKARRQAAYTFAEVLVAVLLIGVLMGAMYSAFSHSFSVLQTTRENLRATQILVQRMETVRLYTFRQLTDTNYVPVSFAEWYDPAGASTGHGGALYRGFITMSIPAGVPAAYSTNMRHFNLTLYWTNYVGSKRIVRTRQMETRVARSGLQNYVYGSSSL